MLLPKGHNEKEKEKNLEMLGTIAIKT